MRFGEKRASVSAQREVGITNELGLHARPAAEFVKRANSFRSEIWVEKDGKRYSAASLIDLLRAVLIQFQRHGSLEFDRAGAMKHSLPSGRAARAATGLLRDNGSAANPHSSRERNARR